MWRRYFKLERTQSDLVIASTLRHFLRFTFLPAFAGDFSDVRLATWPRFSNTKACATVSPLGYSRADRRAASGAKPPFVRKQPLATCSKITNR